MPRFCAEILATGSQCTQFARKGQLWCRAHADPGLRERNADTREHVAWVAGMDLFGVAGSLGKIASELRLRLIQPLLAEAVLCAVLARLDELAEEQAQLATEDGKSHPDKGLQISPMK
jgi:hypothetical protein